MQHHNDNDPPVAPAVELMGDTLKSFYKVDVDQSDMDDLIALLDGIDGVTITAIEQIG